jgi:hypothetical protein
MNNYELDIIYRRLPEVINKYASIDLEYRNILKNKDGKTAEDLALESLINYKQQLTNLKKLINEDKLISLSTTQRYTQSIVNRNKSDELFELEVNNSVKMKLN